MLNAAQLAGTVAVMVPKNLQLKWCTFGSHFLLYCIAALRNVPNFSGDPAAHVPIRQHFEPMTLSQTLAVRHVESEKQSLLQGS